MDSINALVNKYDEIFKLYSTETDELEKSEYKSQLDAFSKLIRFELKKEQELGNCSSELIALCSRFDAVVDTEEKSIENNKEEVIEDKKENTTEDIVYTLASNKIISKLTDEEIDISNMTRIEKAKAIYYHTEQKITYQDPEILKLCDKRVNDFLNSCNPDMYKRQYGENWQEQVAKIYQENYLKTFQNCISNGIREVKEELEEKVAKRHQETERIEQEIEENRKINNDIQEKIKPLAEQFIEISKKINEEDLQKLQSEKTKLEQMKEKFLKYNTPKTYSDGTLMPDNMDEFGRYTTHRNRTDETGIQERVNDAAHVHDELNDMERIKLQRKFEKIFMDTPMYEEEIPPKSR